MTDEVLGPRPSTSDQNMVGNFVGAINHWSVSSLKYGRDHVAPLPYAAPGIGNSDANFVSPPNHAAVAVA